MGAIQRTVAVSAVGLLLVLNGCADEKPSARVAPSSVESPDVGGSVESEPGETEIETESEAPAVTSPAECLRGKWLADNEYFASLMRGLGGEVTSVTGGVRMIFDGAGTVETTYDAWTITMLVEGIDSVIVREGTDSADYQADEQVISVHENLVQSVLTVTSSGFTTMTVPAEPQTFDAAPYTCEGDTASIHAPEGTAKLTRIAP